MAKKRKQAATRKTTLPPESSPPGLDDVLDVIFRFVKNYLVQYGYLEDLAGLTSLSHPKVRAAIALFQHWHMQRITTAKLGLDPVAEAPVADGIVGAATIKTMLKPRCGCKDILTEAEVQAAPALGSAGWKNCHGADGYHKAVVRVMTSTIPRHWSDVVVDAFHQTQKAFDQMGLRYQFVNEDGVDMLSSERVTGNYNIITRWRRLGQPIGMATVGNSHNQRCGDSSMFADFDSYWNPSNLKQAAPVLIEHELGHCGGLEHSDRIGGGIMNSILDQRAAPTWIGDPSEGYLRQWFGGEPILIPGDEMERKLILAWEYEDGTTKKIRDVPTVGIAGVN